MSWEALGAVATAVGALLAGGALVASVLIHRSQQALAIRQQKLTQRQQIINLWDHMTAINHINPQEPIPADVIKMINALELVAVCWEGEAVDRDVINRTFGQQFVSFCGEIEQCVPVEMGQGKVRGSDILTRTPAVLHLYQKLKADLAARDKVAGL